jgi:hypothetical protein
LYEIRLAARWVLGERDPKLALPTERLWSGLPTCCGQMAFLPLAAVFPGDPVNAYLATYALAFIDNGWGRDLNSAIVAGLATAIALVPDESQPQVSWQKIFDSMRSTDPYAYRQVPWTQRSVDRWLDFIFDAVKRAQRRPEKLFAILENEFQNTTKWQAEVPFVVAFASLAICDFEPLAALQLSVEWGHDTDSYAQLLGAFVGALYGASIFPRAMRNTVEDRLQSDYGASLKGMVSLLTEIHQLAASQTVFDVPPNFRQ